MEFISLHLDGAVAEEASGHHSGRVRHRKKSS